MSYIDNNLIDGERVMYRSRLHWLVLVPPALLFVIWMPLAWYLAQGELAGLAWVPLAIGIVALVPAIIRRQSSVFAVTNKRVMMRTGVFTTRSIELFLSKIEAITVDQSLLGKLFGYGDIAITGSGGTSEAFPNIQGPIEFRRAVQSVTDVTHAGTAT